LGHLIQQFIKGKNFLPLLIYLTTKIRYSSQILHDTSKGRIFVLKYRGLVFFTAQQNLQFMTAGKTQGGFS